MEIIGVNINFGVKFLTAIQENMNNPEWARLLKL